MIVTVSSRHTDLTAPLKTFAEQKAGKLTKYFDRVNEIEVVINKEKDQMAVELIVHADRNDRFVAHCKDTDAYAAVDICIEKMERQLSDHKKMVRNRKHPE
jgi:putative sigma-54 modulation protein